MIYKKESTKRARVEIYFFAVVIFEVISRLRSFHYPLRESYEDMHIELSLHIHSAFPHVGKLYKL